ncbi:hypothetical protein QOT17_022450 [Balamuthia mandrillaris]
MEKHFTLPTEQKKKPSKQQELSKAISANLENSQPKQPPSAKPHNCKPKTTTGKKKVPPATGVKAPRKNNKAKPPTSNKAACKHKPPTSPASTTYIKKKMQGHYGMSPLLPWKGDVSNHFSPAPPGSKRTRQPNPQYQNEELIVPPKPAQQARKTSSTISISSSISNSISPSVSPSISSSSSSFQASSHSSASTNPSPPLSLPPPQATHTASSPPSRCNNHSRSKLNFHRASCFSETAQMPRKEEKTTAKTDFIDWLVDIILSIRHRLHCMISFSTFKTTAMLVGLKVNITVLAFPFP